MRELEIILQSYRVLPGIYVLLRGKVPEKYSVSQVTTLVEIHQIWQIPKLINLHNAENMMQITKNLHRNRSSPDDLK